jgi:hypothetical protein
MIFRNFPAGARLTLPDPAHHRLWLQLGRRLVLAITPGATPAAGVFLTATASADHGLIVTSDMPAGTTTVTSMNCLYLYELPVCRLPFGPQQGDQAAFAFARRIRLRRSAERSSSFNPPQVPYFSGLLTA